MKGAIPAPREKCMVLCHQPVQPHTLENICHGGSKSDLKCEQLRTVKTALNLLFVTRKYAKILHWFTEIEWLPSVGFLALSSLFSPLVSSE